MSSGFGLIVRATVVGLVWYVWGRLFHPSTGDKDVIGLVTCSIAAVAITLICMRWLLADILYIKWGVVHLFNNFVLFPFLLSSFNIFKTSPPQDLSLGFNACRLCDRCESIVRQSNILHGAARILIPPVEKYPFYTRSDLELSAKGCHLCRILLLSLGDCNTEGPHDHSMNHETCNETIGVEGGHSEPPPGEGTNTVRIRKIRDRRTGSLDLQMQLGGASKPLVVDWQHREFVRHSCYDSLYTDCGDVAMWARSWIDICSNSHDRCRNQFVDKASKQELPLRLIYVGDDNDRGTVSLILTQDLENPRRCVVEYCASSHRRGGTVKVTLTRENADKTKTIQVRTLEKNFQDAIAITRKLGIPYLWIDCLCIAQGDKAEWQRESAMMGLVYANAKCVISATASQDSTGGCFLPHNLDYNDCVLFKRAGEVLVVRSGRDAPPPSVLFETQIERAPITARGWTFQERFLCSRMLHFCDGFVFFECNTLTATEYDQSSAQYPTKWHVREEGTPHSQELVEAARRPSDSHKMSKAYSDAGKMGGRPRFRRYKKMLKTEQQAESRLRLRREALRNISARLGMRGAFDLLWRFQGKSLVEMIEFHCSWFDMVEQYSGRHLTLSSDRAMAIAGVAYFIQLNTGLQYAAGLWTKILPLNLLWTVGAAARPGLRPTRSAPTWSWTSVDGKISQPFASTIPETHPGEPQIKRPALTSLISDATLIYVDTIGSMVHNAVLTLNGHLHQLSTEANHSIHTTFDTSPHPGMEETRFLPVLLSEDTMYPVPASHPPKKVWGIFLSRVPGSASRRFERVGYGMTGDPELVHMVITNQLATSVIEIQ